MIEYINLLLHDAETFKDFLGSAFWGLVFLSFIAVFCFVLYKIIYSEDDYL